MYTPPGRPTLASQKGEFGLVKVCRSALLPLKPPPVAGITWTTMVSLVAVLTGDVAVMAKKMLVRYVGQMFSISNS